MQIKQGIILGAVLGLATSRMALAEPTALDLIKRGDDYVGIQSKDKVIQIYSDKSVASLQPNVWHVVYFDPSVFSRITDVKFEAGQQSGIGHMHPFALPAKSDQILDLSKITVDSDRAVQIAAAQPLLKGLNLRYSKITLEKGDNGPEWKVELWSAKVSDPTKDANVGDLRVSATDGSVIQSNLHPGNAGGTE
ncbi:MAG TPA: hypothetical protein VGY56_03900 [Verrucomicrobiae bacterium]|nr:hypothetical protein [Verrucomicrobiae bacterium]